jgi:N-acetylmuramic acid 6-phosphate etherase
MPKRKRHLSTTETRHRRASGLDQMSTPQILSLLNAEDATVAPAVRRELRSISRVVDELIVPALQAGGRLFYAGAGTSGRLAALDAAEIPPTFGVPCGVVQALIAGGATALTRAIEDAEDSLISAPRALQHAGVGSGDVVGGITASGSTPYVLSALRAAKALGARTFAITAHPESPVARLAEITIAPRTGAEILAGSTRLKAGTAQKLVLNLLSTSSMIRLGHVYDSWMIDVTQTNNKLRQRAVRILSEAASVRLSGAKHTLRLAGHNLRIALVMQKAGISASEARQTLTNAGGDIRTALQEFQPTRTRKAARRRARKARIHG